MIYGEDSFFSLTTFGRIGLGLLSVTLAVWWVLCVRRLSFGRALWLRLLIALIGFALFVSLSPQIYYSYYHQLFPDLPRQWVTRAPSVIDLLQRLSFTGPQTMAAHSAGALGWALIFAAFAKNSPQRRNAAN